MPASHRRVTQPSYLRREPTHIAGQLLKLIHGGTTLSPPCRTAARGGSHDAQKNFRSDGARSVTISNMQLDIDTEDLVAKNGKSASHPVSGG